MPSEVSSSPLHLSSSSLISPLLATPLRIFPSHRTNVVSLWRWTHVSSNDLCMHAFHASDSKQNLRAFCTGGSWWKSPTSTSWMLPKGRLTPRTALAIFSSRSNVAPSTIDISSIISTLHANHFRLVSGRLALRTSTSNGASPRPMPAKLCSVVPPSWHAAKPVEAVKKVEWDGSSCRMRRSNSDLPVPAGPVRNKLFPCMIYCSATSCSSLSG
mmetsp:Transcript_45478/g.116364  ORF Transcript_45478/g.116364 Transcript_45478/m.116364 type:complete len:214 (+) Transcript_45478:996-1637(+)